MDETDIRLIQMLMINSRVPYREMASELGLSLQSVHKRVQGMIDSGVIQRFTASISPYYLDSLIIDVIAKSNALDIDAAIRRIGESEFTDYVILGGGNYIVLAAVLHKNAELDGYIQWIIQEARLTDVWLGIESFGFAGRTKIENDGSEEPLTSLDFRIIRSLRDDARKPTNEIAAEIGVSSKTVARRMDRMTKANIIMLYINWSPGIAPGVISVLLIHLREGVDKRAIASKLIDRYSPRIAFLRSYGNHPDMFGAISWTPTPILQDELSGEIGKENEVRKVDTFVLIRKYEFGTWVDDLIEKKARSVSDCM